MKAIQMSEVGGPEVLQLVSLPDPKAGPGQVVLRAKAIGVNPVETYIRAGNYKMPPLPLVPGFDAAGLVDEVGPDVKNLKVGDRVYAAGTISGAYAEKILARANQVFPLPEGIGFPQGAALGVPYATAYRSLMQRARAQSGEFVLVHGASGGVGLAAVQMAKAHGLKVFGTSSTAEGREMIRREGAQQAFDHRDPAYLEKILAATNGRGVDVILEMVAAINLGKDLTILAPKGRVVVIGSRGNVEINPRDLMARDAAIFAMSLFNVSEPDLQEIHTALAAGLKNRTLRPIIRCELPLRDAAKAHTLVAEPGALGKIVLIP